MSSRHYYLKPRRDWRGRFANPYSAHRKYRHDTPLLTAIESEVAYKYFRHLWRTDQIAERMGCTEAAVANSLDRLREFRRLADRLE